jgi:hypothetical protein
LVTSRRSKAGASPKARHEIQAPWSTEGWSTREDEKDPDPELDRELQKAAGPTRGTAYVRRSPGLAINPVMNNPYFSGALGAPFGWAAWFVFDKLQEQIVLAFAIAGFFGFVALVAVLVSIRRVPAWHRARRVARAWIAEHGGVMPSDLRWYN